jgi:hypothetical protein
MVPYSIISQTPESPHFLLPTTFKREYPALKNLKFFHFCRPFLPLWIRMQQTKEMRNHADPDPQHALELKRLLQMTGGICGNEDHSIDTSSSPL